MSRHLSFVALAVAVVVGAVAPSDSGALAESPESCPISAPNTNPGTVTIDCEVYQIAADDLKATVASLSQDAGAAYKALMAGGEKASRIARFHGPTQLGREVSFTSNAQVPIVSINRGQFSDQTSFSGYQEASSSLNFQTSAAEEGYSTRFSIHLQRFSGDAEVKHVAPPRSTTRLDGSANAAAGAPVMYQLESGDDAVVVFLTVHP